MRAGLRVWVRRMSLFAFAATIVLTPLRYHRVWLARPVAQVYPDYTDILWYASDIPLVATLALWLAGLALQPRAVKTGPRILSVPIAALTAMALLSAAFSDSAGYALYQVLRLALLGGLWLFVVNELDDLRWVFVPVGIQVFTQSAVGLAQTLGQNSLGLARLGELELNPAWSGVSVVSAGGARLLRAYGLTDHPNILGGCLAFGLIVIAAWYLCATSAWRAALGGLIGLGAMGLLLAFSRSAWLALAGGMAVFALLLWRDRQSRSLAELGGLLLAGAIVCLPLAWQYRTYVGARLDQGDSFSQVFTENRSLEERAAVNRATLRIFLEHPLAGVGPGLLTESMAARFPQFDFYVQPAHNTALAAAAEVGAPGAMIYLAALLAPWAALWHASRRRRLDLSPALIGASALLFALMLVGVFDYYPWSHPSGRLWQWLAWGLWAVAFQRSSRETGNVES